MWLTRPLAEPAAGALPLTRRALLPLPLLLTLPLRTPGADTFSYVENGQTKQLTELEARDALTKKVDAATAAGQLAGPAAESARCAAAGRRRGVFGDRPGPARAGLREQPGLAFSSGPQGVAFRGQEVFLVLHGVLARASSAPLAACMLSP